MYTDGVVTQKANHMPDTTVIARFTFKPDRAREFSENGNQVVEMELDSIDEVTEFCKEFETAIVDVQALIDGRVVSLPDFTFSI